MKQDTRAAFEKWYGDNYSNYALTLRSGDRYSNLDTELAWQSWQAAIVHAVPRWITVEERLPERYAEVMIYPRPDFGTECFTGEYYGEVDGWVVSEYVHNYGIEHHKNQKITHWMQLPPAPAAQEDK